MEGIELENISIPLIKGEKGDKGDTGATGATGASGVGISSAEIVDEHLILHLSNGTDVDTGVVVGAGVSSIVIDENYDVVVILTDGTEMTAGNLEDLLDDIFTTELADYYDKDTADSIFATIDETGNKISLSINSSTYVMTLSLLDKNDTVLSTGTIDLPLESVVVSGSYDSVNKKIVLTLQSGSTVEFSVADLVSGLISTSDLETALTNYITNTDYPNGTNAGVIKPGNSFSASNTGVAECGTLTYSTYQSSPNKDFISKGTLENVITGKDLTTKAYVDSLVGDIGTTLDTIQGEVI